MINNKENKMERILIVDDKAPTSEEIDTIRESYGEPVDIDVLTSASEASKIEKDYDAYLVDAQMERSYETERNFERLKEDPEAMKRVEDYLEELETFKRKLVLEEKNVAVDVNLDHMPLTSCRFNRWFKRNEFYGLFSKQTGIDLVDRLNEEGKRAVLHTKGFDHGPHTFIYALMSDVLGIEDITSAYLSIKENRGIKVDSREEYEVDKDYLEKHPEIDNVAVAYVLWTKKPGVSDRGNLIVNPKESIDDWVYAIGKAVEHAKE